MCARVRASVFLRPKILNNTVYIISVWVLGVLLLRFLRLYYHWSESRLVFPSCLFCTTFLHKRLCLSCAVNSILQTAQEVIGHAKMKFFQRIFLFVNLLDTIFGQSTPITLDYKPIKPFYLPANFIYPQPMIPPGTPWPASRTTDLPVTNKINSELPIKSNEENQNGLLVPTTFSTIESSTTNIVESSSRSPAEENIFNLLCLIIPCLSTSIHKETGNPLEQIVNYTTSRNDIDSTEKDVPLSPSYESSTDKMTEIITPLPDVDIRIKPVEAFDPDRIVFPDQLIAATVPSKLEASNILSPAIVSKISSEENNKTSEELKDKSKPVATDDATLKPATTTVINLEYKPTRPPYVPDPVLYPQSAIKPETSRPLAEEDATSKSATTTVINLEYNPSRPPFVPDPVFYPQPAIKPDAPKPFAEKDATSKLATTTLKSSSTTVIDLEYKPTRPTFIPNPVVYPQPAIKPETSKPLAEEETTSKPSSTTGINLEYKPTRSPYVPDPVFYPQPAINPDTLKPLAEEDGTSKPSPTTVVNLEYKPTRPTFIPGPIVYPQPAINTSPSVNHTSGSTFSTLSDKFASSVVTNTASPSGNNEITTKRIITTRKPTYTTPISLEYKPTRPFYVPNPIFYPKPAIPPGTPWPAYSTTKSLLTDDNLV